MHKSLRNFAKTCMGWPIRVDGEQTGLISRHVCFRSYTLQKPVGVLIAEFRTIQMHSVLFRFPSAMHHPWVLPCYGPSKKRYKLMAAKNSDKILQYWHKINLLYHIFSEIFHHCLHHFLMDGSTVAIDVLSSFYIYHCRVCPAEELTRATHANIFLLLFFL